MFLALLQVFIVVLGVILWRLSVRWKAPRDLPPGPKPLPLVGNIFDLPPPSVPEYQHWIKFKDTYGPLSSVTVLGTNMILVHSHDVLQDLMVKRSTKTSSRPKQHFAGELCGFDVLTPSLPYNATHRLHRKFMHQQMGTRLICERFWHVQDVESRRFLLRVLDDPSNIISHIKTEASAIILRITYGYSIEPHKVDPLVTLIEHMMGNFSDALVPLTWSVDLFPFLKHLPTGFPGASFKKIAQEWKERVRMAADIPYSFVLRQMANGNPTSSYVSSLVTEYSKNPENDWKPTESEVEMIKNSAAIIYGGGADTTVSTLSSLVLAMLLFPDVQQKAQEELDRVVGSDRLPEFEDRENLPYVNALIKETLRWLPVVPVGTTHVTEEEMFHSGYRIPKGSFLLPSIWWFLHDPAVYPKPETFDPERFLEPRNEPDPANHAFGYGRRICPGRYLADDNLFLTISRLLATFEISKALDEKGCEIDVEVEVTAGLISHPKTFPYGIKPRSPRHVEIIRSTESKYPWEEPDVRHLEQDHLQYLNIN
ncbi:hypothetical protein NW767_011271 [Fusarium falciforme]|nr:hypothetical protein NW767_011271 [Fusarium falciforme]